MPLTQQLKCNQAKRPTCASALAGKETWTLSTGNPSTWKKTHQKNVKNTWKTRSSKQWKYYICPLHNHFGKLSLWIVFLQIDVRSSIFLQIVVPDKYLKNHDNLLFNWLLLFIFPSSQILQIVVVVNFSKMVVLDIFSQICQFTAAVFRKLIIVKSFFTTICSR